MNKMKEAIERMLTLPQKGKIKIFCSKVFSLVLWLILILWFLQFYFVFRSAIFNTGMEQHVQFSERNIWAMQIMLWSMCALVVLWTLRMRWLKKVSWAKISEEYTETSLKYLFLILEMALGLYIAAVIFVIKFDSYDPRLVLVMNGLIAFFVLEKIKIIVAKKYFQSVTSTIQAVNVEKAEEDLYVRVLMWANEKQETGFTWDNLTSYFSLSPLQESWVRKIFLTTNDQDRKFFEHFRNDDSVTPNQHYYSLNEKGMTAAINYKGLAHAEKNSSSAIWFAGLSILLTAIGIFFQIKQTRLTEIQAIPEQINQARAKQGAIEFCKENTDALAPNQYYLDGSGRSLTCSELLELYK